MVAQTNHQITKCNGKKKLTQMICLQIGKTTEAKPHMVNLRSPFLKIHYYQSQVVISKRNPSTQYQPIVEPLPQYPIGLVL